MNNQLTALNCIFQFFLQLQQAAVSLNDEVLLAGLGLMELGQLAALEGSLFDSLLALLDRLKGDMMGRLLDWTMREFKEKAKPYSQNRYKRNLNGAFGPLCWTLGSKSLDVCVSVWLPLLTVAPLGCVYIHLQVLSLSTG